MGRIIHTKIAGVMHNNTNGISRQKILRKCYIGEQLELKRDYENTFDEHAIAVLKKTGEQIGFIPREIAFRHAGMNDLATHLDQGGYVKIEIVNLSKKECYVEIEVIGSAGQKPYQLKEKEARELRDKAKKLERSDPKEAIKLYRKSVASMLEVDSLIRDTHHFKKQISELGYDIGTWRRASMSIERITALLEKEKQYFECFDEIVNYERIGDKKGINQNDLRKIRGRMRRISKILEPNKSIDKSLLTEQIKILKTSPNRFHEINTTFHSYDYSIGLANHYRAKIDHLGLKASIIITEFEKDKLTMKINDQFKKWDKEWLKYLKQDLEE